MTQGQVPAKGKAARSALREYQALAHTLALSEKNYTQIDSEFAASSVWDSELKAFVDSVTLKSLFYSENWVYITVDLVAGKIANQKLRVMRKVREGGQVTAVPAENHPLQATLECPNKYQDYHAYMYSTVVDLVLIGNSLTWKGITGNTLLPIPAESVSIDLDKQGQMLGYRSTEFTFAESMLIPKGSKTFAPGEVIHIKRPHPSSLLWGLSPFVPGRKSILFNRYSTDYLNGFYIKGAAPGMALELGDAANEKNALRLLRSFEGAYIGRRNQRRTLVLPKGVTAKQMSHTLADQQLKDYIDKNREDILALLRVPKHEFTLQTAGSLGSEEYKTALVNFWSATLLPTMRMIEGAFNKAFAAMLGSEFFFQFDVTDVAILQESAQDKARLAEGMLKTHTVNEVRAALYKAEPIDGGDNLAGVQPGAPGIGAAPASVPAVGGGSDKPLAAEAAANQVTTQAQALNGAQIDSLVKIVQEVGLGTIPRDSALGIIRIAFALSPADAEAVLGTPLAVAPAASPAEPAGTVTVEAEAPDAALAIQHAVADRFIKSNTDWVAAGQDKIAEAEGTAAESMTELALALLQKQADLAAKALRKADKALPTADKLRKLLMKALTADELETLWTANGTKYLEPAMETGHGVGLTFPFKVPDEAALMAASDKNKAGRRKLLVARLLKTFQYTSEATTEKMMAVIADGIAKGEGSGKIAERLIDDFGNVKNIKTRADTIARTESATASSIGKASAINVAAQVIPNLKKIWINVGDRRVRGNPGGEYPKTKQDHWKLHGQVRDFDKPFEDPRSGVKMMFPRDPSGPPDATINCRCDVVALPADQMDKYQEDVT